MANNFFKFLMIGLTAFLIGSCGNADHNKKLETLPFLIDWDPEPTYLGIYYAKSLGLFEDLGFDVQIVPLRGANQVVPAIANGANPIGTASGGATVIGASNDNKVLSLAVLYKQIPTVIYGLGKTGIETPQDLKGKRIGIYPTSITKDEFMVFLNANDIGVTDLEIIDAVGSDLEMLNQNQIDAALNYIEMSPARLTTSEQNSKSGNNGSFEIRLAENGVPGYGLNIITSPAEYKRRPKIMEALSNAAVQGYIKGCQNPNDAIATYMREIFKTPSRIDANKGYVLESWKRVCDMLGDRPGVQTLKGWKETVETYSATGRLNSKVNPAYLFPN